MGLGLWGGCKGWDGMVKRGRVKEWEGEKAGKEEEEEKGGYRRWDGMVKRGRMK